MIRSVLVAFVLSSLVAEWTQVVLAHEGHEHPKSSTPKFPRAIVLPAMDGPRPWSDKPLLDDPDRFQIAIMTDHTGGHRPGIWMKAVERLNWLRPTFVMSIGDLIEGYSSDPDEIEAEWKEFQGFVDQMKMKFFFVAGNHDVKNPTMHEIWRKNTAPNGTPSITRASISSACRRKIRRTRSGLYNWPGWKTTSGRMPKRAGRCYSFTSLSGSCRNVLWLPAIRMQRTGRRSSRFWAVDRIPSSRAMCITTFNTIATA